MVFDQDLQGRQPNAEDMENSMPQKATMSSHEQSVTDIASNNDLNVKSQPVSKSPSRKKIEIFDVNFN